MTTAGQRRIYEARPQLVALMTALSSGDAKAAVDLIRGKTLAETGTLLCPTAPNRHGPVGE